MFHFLSILLVLNLSTDIKTNQVSKINERFLFNYLSEKSERAVKAEVIGVVVISELFLHQFRLAVSLLWRKATWLTIRPMNFN